MWCMNKVQEKKGQTGEIQHKPEQTWHYSCNLRQLSQDLYTWPHVTQAGIERRGPLVVVIKETNPGAAPLALNDISTFWTDSVSEVMLRKVKQTFFDSISLRFIVNGADPRFVLWWHQIMALVLWFLALWGTCCRRKPKKYRCTRLHLEGIIWKNLECIFKDLWMLHLHETLSETYKS